MVSKKQKYLNSIYDSAGLYMITPTIKGYSINDKLKVKIGIASDLHDRFGAYLLCYPSGFHIFSIFLNKNKKESLRLERTIHRYLNAKYKIMITKHSHSEETMLLSRKEVNTLIETIKSNRGKKFRKDQDIISKADQVNVTMFPYMKILPEIFLDENLAQGGTRIIPFHEDVKDYIDSSCKKKPIKTSVKKQKRKSIKLPVKVPKMGDLTKIKVNKKTQKKSNKK